MSCIKLLTVPFGVSSLLTALLHMPEKPTSVLFLISKAVALTHVIRLVLRNEVSLEPYCPSTPHTQNVSLPFVESAAGWTIAVHF